MKYTPFILCLLVLAGCPHAAIITTADTSRTVPALAVANGERVARATEGVGKIVDTVEKSTPATLDADKGAVRVLGATVLEDLKQAAAGDAAIKDRGVADAQAIAAVMARNQKLEEEARHRSLLLKVCDLAAAACAVLAGGILIWCAVAVLLLKRPMDWGLAGLAGVLVCVGFGYHLIPPLFDVGAKIAVALAIGIAAIVVAAFGVLGWKLWKHYQKGLTGDQVVGELVKSTAAVAAMGNVDLKGAAGAVLKQIQSPATVMAVKKTRIPLPAGG